MITIIVDDDCFQPSTMVLPKEDFPSDMYDCLKQHSTVSKCGTFNSLDQPVRWNTKSPTHGSHGTYIIQKWADITQLVDQLVRMWPNIHHPAWSKRAMISHHRPTSAPPLEVQGEVFRVVVRDIWLE